jgi:integrase
MCDNGCESAVQGWRSELEAAGRARGTVGVRVSHVRRALDEIGKPVGDVTRRDLVRWLAGHDWAPATRRSVRASLRSFWSWWALETGGENVAAELPIVVSPRAVPRPASDWDVMEAIRAAEPWVALAIEVMATCGLRRAECAALRVQDVTPVGQGWTLRVVGKGGNERVIPCPPHLARAIHSRGGGWVFPGGQDGHVSPGWLGKRVSRVLGAGVTPHMLRHRFASVCYSHTHDLRAVQTLLGHASVATTQVYTAVTAEDIREVATTAWRIVS